MSNTQSDLPPQLQEFLSDLESAKKSPEYIAKKFLERHGSEPELNEKSFAWIVGKSGLPWLQLDLSFPYEKMCDEAKRLRDRFYVHKDYADDNSIYSQNKGWKALVIHGLGPDKTMDAKYYGHSNVAEAPYHWTEIADLCPITTEFFKKTWPATRLFRLRFMILEPGGYILPHKDRIESILYETNFALSNPEGFVFKMEGHGYVPFEPGRAFILDVSNIHGVANYSDKDRIHIIVHGETLRHTGWQKLMQKSFRKYLKEIHA